MTFANSQLEKLYVIFKWFRKLIYIHFFLFLWTKDFHILMYKCIYKPIHHTQTPKTSRTFHSSLAITYACQIPKLAKHLEKPLIFRFHEYGYIQNLRTGKWLRNFSFVIHKILFKKILCEPGQEHKCDSCASKHEHVNKVMWRR